jgi:hypothetical protein
MGKKKNVYHNRRPKNQGTIWGFTKKELKTIIMGFVAIVAIFLIVLYVPDMARSWKALRVGKDGTIQGVPDNALIADFGTDKKHIYRELGTVDAADGYVLDSVEEGLSDKNLRYFRFVPEEGSASPVQVITAQVAKGSAADMAAETPNRYRGYVSELISESEVTHEEIAGLDCYYFTLEYNFAMKSDENGDAQVSRHQSCLVYIASKYDQRSIVIQAENSDQNGELTDLASLTEAAKSFIPHIALADKT